MSRLANDEAGIAVPVLAVIVAVVFIAVLFFKFVDMVGAVIGERKLRRGRESHFLGQMGLPRRAGCPPATTLFRDERTL